MGGPESVDDVELYLMNIFSDPDIFDVTLPPIFKKILINRIIKKRIPKTKAIYQQIGGSSPLNKITQKQAKLLNQKSKRN